MRFCFYSGYRDQKGGYTTLLINLATELHRQTHEVVLINYQDGLIVRELKKENISITLIDLDTIDWAKIDQQIFPTDIVIVTKFEEVYHHLFKINPKAVYFDINDFIGRISGYKFGLRFSSLGKKLVEKLLATKSLFFMDDTGVFNLKSIFSIEVQTPLYLPIPVNVPGENLYLKKQVNPAGVLRLTYIGRSAKWKMMPLKKILSDCAASSKTRKIQFSVVVDSVEGLKKYIDLDAFRANPNMTVEVIENLPPSAVNGFLLDHADLHFAMGTAALDAASLGIPTILVDYSEHDFPSGYQYQWLFETKNYSLGKNLDKLPASSKGFTLDDLLNICSNPEERQKNSVRSYEYVRQQHVVQKIVPEMVRLCAVASFRIKDASALVPFYFKTHRLVKNLIKVIPKK